MLKSLHSLQQTLQLASQTINLRIPGQGRYLSNHLLVLLQGRINGHHRNNQDRHTTLSQCDRVRSERLQLFRPRPFSWSSSSFSGHGRGSRHSSYKNKRRVATWQHDFVCLARMDTNSPPSPLGRGILLQAGLGVKRIIFADCHDSEIFHSEILEEFPKLRDAGG